MQGKLASCHQHLAGFKQHAGLGKRRGVHALCAQFSPKVSHGSILAGPADEQALLFAAGGGKPKIAARPNSRKAKSPAPGLSSGERPPSVSSVHSEGDCNRRTPLTNRVWEDRPSSAGIAWGGGRVPVVSHWSHSTDPLLSAPHRLDAVPLQPAHHAAPQRGGDSGPGCATATRNAWRAAPCLGRGAQAPALLPVRDPFGQ